MRLLHGDVSHVHRHDAYDINFSDGNVRICEGAPELLVLGESFLPRENVGGPAVPNGVFHSIRNDRVLHYVAAVGGGAFSYVPKYMHTDIAGRAIHRSADRSSNERGERSVHRTRDVGADHPVLRLLR